MTTDDAEGATFGTYDYRKAAHETANHESVADGFRKIFERLDALYELASPLLWVRQRDLTQPVTLSPGDAQQLAELLTAIGHLSYHYTGHASVLRDADLAPPGWDVLHRPQQEWREEHALRSWRAGEELLANRRARYEQAIAIGLEYLQRFATLDALVTHYFDDRYTYGSPVPKDPPEGTVEAWAVAARQAVPGGDELAVDVLTEAAFWQRARQLGADLLLGQVDEKKAG